jgi:hypothetical protein
MTQAIERETDGAPDEVVGVLTETKSAIELNGILDHPGSPYFAAPDFYDMEPIESLHLIRHFETKQQETNYNCGCACVWMVMNHFGFATHDERTIEGHFDQISTRGTNAYDLKRFFESIGWTVECHADTRLKFHSLEELETYLIERIDHDIPVMVDWLDWGGHWQVAIGLDTMGTDNALDDVLIMADPYDVTDHCQDGYYVVSLARFFRMWREGHGSYGQPPFEQPYLVAVPPNHGSAALVGPRS